MKNVSIKKLSILGLVLIGASAVTAAMLPGKSVRTDSTPDDGTLVNANGDSTDGLTCLTRSGAQSCNKSKLSGQTTNSSAPANGSSVRNNATTNNLTSNSAAGYNSSVERDLG